MRIIRSLHFYALIALFIYMLNMENIIVCGFQGFTFVPFKHFAHVYVLHSLYGFSNIYILSYFRSLNLSAVLNI